MTVTLTNNEIYNYANSLMEYFSDSEVKFPIKVNFYLQKNKNALTTLAQDIEQERINIIQEYGKLDEETQQFSIPQEKMAEDLFMYQADISNIEKAKSGSGITDLAKLDMIADLFNLTQDVNLYKVNLDSFGDMELTANQMQALLFMIEDNEE